MFLKFKDNPRTNTDDYLFKKAAQESLISTIGGLTITGFSVLVPVIIAFSNAATEVKLAAFGSGMAGGFAGSLTTRYKPNFPPMSLSDQGEEY